MAIIVAEIGANHNGSLDIAVSMIDAAAKAGCDFVKFQKRTPALAIPIEQQEILRETPWGLMSYIDYRHELEFDKSEFDIIHSFCKGRIGWFGSAWDIPSADFLLSYKPPYIKVPSAKITDMQLLDFLRENHGDAEIVISTGMSTLDEVETAVGRLGNACSHIMHCNSTYPAPVEELNLLAIQTLSLEFPEQHIGYSGHETGLATTVAAVALGAEMVERHFTLDRSWWGTDQAASVEPQGMRKLVDDIRAVERALGDGVKKVYPSEIPARDKLRGVPA